MGAIITLSGCVRESSSADVVEYHYKWWAWLWALAPLAVAGLIAGKYPTAWINGAWRPWWTFRDWALLDAIRAIGAIVLVLVAPFQLANRVVVSADALQESNFLGLRPTRRMAWNELARIDLKADLPPGPFRPDLKREHDKKPSCVAVRRDGPTEELRGWLIDQAQTEIVRRAQAAGVAVITTPDPGAMPPAMGPPARPGMPPNVPPQMPPRFPPVPGR